MNSSTSLTRPSKAFKIMQPTAEERNTFQEDSRAKLPSAGLGVGQEAGATGSFAN
jgi:hypothetical protein